MKFLPKSFLSVLGNNPSVTDVLNARCVNPQAIMPTLVASYTQQHCLDKTHLEKKGIFASLVEEDGNFRFVDPFRFICLLGTPCIEVVPLPIKIDIAFRQIGNSISVMHALTCLLVAINGIRLVETEITSTVMQCWQDRFTTDNSIVVRNRDYAFLVPHALATKLIVDMCTPFPGTGITCCIRFESGESIRVDFVEGMTISELMRTMGIEKLATSNVSVCSDFQVIDPKTDVRTIHEIDLHCRNKSSILFSMRVCLPQQGVDNEHGETGIADSLDQVIGQKISQIERLGCDQIECPPTVQYGVHQGVLGHCGEIDDVEQIEHENKGEGQQQGFEDSCDEVFWIFLPESDTPIEMFWPKDMSKDAVEVRVKFLQNPSDSTYLRAIECRSHPFENVNRVFVMVPSSVPDDFVAILIWNERRCQFHPRCITPKIIPWNIAVKVMPDVSAIAINGRQTPMFEICNLQSGDVICLSNHKKQCVEQSSVLNSTADRASLFQIHGPSLASDELEWCSKRFNEAQQNFEILQHVSPVAFLHKIHDFVREHCDKGFMMTVVPILFQDHWAACELKGTSNISLTFINIPASFQHFHSEAKMRVELLARKSCNCKRINVPSPNGFCGWALLFRWSRFESELVQLINSWGNSSHNENPHRVLLGPCIEDIVYNDLWTFGVIVRYQFLGLFPITELPHRFQVGSTGQDVNMAPPNQDKEKPDPWLKYDPWAIDKKQMSKWEDLRLPKDHYFKDKDDSSVTQLHRQQLNAGSNAIAFATRANVIPTFSSCNNKAIGLLIPSSERVKFDFKPDLQMSGPHEIVVQDDAVGTVYKRQVYLVQLDQHIRFEMPQATYKTKAPELKELVIEIDERLLNKDMIAAIIDGPLDAFKKRFQEQVPSVAAKGVNVYAFRIVNVQNPKHRIFQTMCKVPIETRKLCLQRSGMGDLFLRDYIPKGEEILDVSTIPRFWSCERSGKEDALRTASDVEGFAGLVLTKRGVAVRAWCSQIGAVRRILLPNDERLTDLNIDIIPRHLFESTGWPTSIAAQEVVKATNFATKASPIPTRCFKMLGLTTWTLAFQEKPPAGKFLIDFNGSSYEILLSESQVNHHETKNAKQGKKESKGKGKGSKSASSQEDKPFQNQDETSQRISVLEAKFNTMERRQDSLESKINDGFSSVNDQLRQVLQAITPKAAHDPTGLSPPPKMPKL